MSTRREIILTGMAAAGIGPVALAQAPDAWRIPPNERIRDLLIDRIDRQGRGVGLVVGVVEPAGRRFVAYGGTGTGRLVDADTVFQIGSISKVVVTLILSDMVQRGEVALDDPAQALLPKGVTMPARGRPITLRDLATHVSGLPAMPTNFSLKASPNPIAAYTEAQLYAFLSTYELPREPGSGFGYSNVAVALLGRLLARRQGVDYIDLAKARVLRPLGMTSTSILLDADQGPRLAAGHDMYRRPVDSWEMRAMPASGSLRSTARDLLALLDGYLGYRETPLKPAMAFQTSQPSPANTPVQTLGLPIRTDALGRNIFCHDGAKSGYRSFLAFNPQARTGVVILANARSQDGLDGLALHLLSGRPMPPTEPMPAPPPVLPAVRVPRETLDRYEGRYRLETGAVMAVAGKDRRLFVDLLGEGPMEYFAQSPTVFTSRVTTSQVKVVVGADGHATALVLNDNGRERTATRLA